MSSSYFLTILREVIRVVESCKVYNTNFHSATFDLTENDGQIVLHVSFPTRASTARISTCGTYDDDIYAKLKEIKAFRDAKKNGDPIELV